MHHTQAGQCTLVLGRATLSWPTVHRAQRRSEAVEGVEGSGGGTYKLQESHRMILIGESKRGAQLCCIGNMRWDGGCALNKEECIWNQDELEVQWCYNVVPVVDEEQNNVACLPNTCL
ncbi:hypothetical protein JB92DRAFT_2829918 [Gautieria morchelliformis]|nr:hypothetical protein JB92DRAFT_2829918 [Gautieria morchelliformis]